MGESSTCCCARDQLAGTDLRVGQGIVLATIGPAIEVAAALMTSRLPRSLLFGVEPAAEALRGG